MVILNVHSVTTRLNAVKGPLLTKVGIFSGTFDPVHSGHIAFALSAAQSAGLDKVYFLPESLPRRKQGVTHYAHRMAMLDIALKPFPKLAILELPDKQFSVNKTLPKLKKLLADSELFILVGSDVLDLLASDQAETKWPGHQRLLESAKLIVGVREGGDVCKYEELMSVIQDEGIVVSTDKPHMSSRDIRRAIMQGKLDSGLLESLKKYVDMNWLYVSVDPNNS